LKELKKAATFQTIPSFWSCWNEVQEICSMPLEGGVNYHLFKDTIKPVWEDPKNIKGGKWSFVLPSSTPHQEVMKHWMSLMLTVLIGELGTDSEINGVVLSVRSWGCIFSIWNRNANNKRLVDTVTDKLKELFGVVAVKYQRHQVRVKRNNAQRAKIAHAKRNYSSDESISSNDSSSSSEGEQEKVIQFVRRSPENEIPRTTLNNISSDKSIKSEQIQQHEGVKESEVISTHVESKDFDHQEIEQIHYSQQDLEDLREKRRAIRISGTNSRKETKWEMRHIQDRPLRPQQQKEERIPVAQLGILLVAGILVSIVSWSLYL